MTLVLTDCTECTESFELHDHAERRRGLRVQQARPVQVYEPGGARYFGGVTEDISATGLRIELPASASLRPGKIITVHVSRLANRRQMIPARVVWIDRGATMGQVVAGVEFLASIAAHLDAA
jgi:c-di-GMP-binding flagellar brake protein YcgR